MKPLKNNNNKKLVEFFYYFGNFLKFANGLCVICRENAEIRDSKDMGQFQEFDGKKILKLEI